ncbi:MAG TPA: hypothetical protein VLJ21_05260 [Candidatus Binatia bacterium]|nr:hypothetical protein [Candidatus Binatia bacterium]
MRRGQLTLIIIVVLLVLIIVGIVLYAARSASSKRGEERVETQQRTAALLKPVQEYVTQCLDLSARSIIEILGKQGGHVYTSQGGITPDPLVLGTDYVLDGTTKVTYAILPPEGNVGTLFFAKTPDYPWPTFPMLYNDTPNALGTYDVLIPEYLQGYFGRNQLLQLEGTNSLQEELEAAVLAKTQSCIDWSVFEKQGLSVETGTPSLQVVFGTRGTSFLLYYPANLTSEVSGTKTHVDSFATELPVRMKAIHELAHYVMDKEVTNLSFDPTSLVLDQVQVSTSHDAYLHDDLLQFIDPASSLGGVQYVFQVARKNRAPALVWIPNDTIATWKLCDGSVISFDGTHLSGDVSNCVGSFTGFNVEVRAYDPDEDAVTFRAFAGGQQNPLQPSYTVTYEDASSYREVQIVVEASDSQFTDPDLTDRLTFRIPAGTSS